MFCPIVFQSQTFSRFKKIMLLLFNTRIQEISNVYHFHFHSSDVLDVMPGSCPGIQNEQAICLLGCMFEWPFGGLHSLFYSKGTFST